VLRALPERFAHLQGWIASVSFDEVVGIGRGPKKRAERAGEVVTALNTFRPPAVQQLEQQLDPDMIHPFNDGHVTAALLGENYSSPLQVAKGFELALNFPTEIFEEEAWGVMERRVKEKDLVDGAHTLLVSAGSPTTTGLTFPSDSVLASIVLRAAETRALAATRLQRIWLHDWSSESVHAFTPGVVGWSSSAANPSRCSRGRAEPSHPRSGGEHEARRRPSSS
jgi:hypothetical protein